LDGASQSADPWEGKPWMYSKPAGSSQLKYWKDEWGKVLLSRAEEENISLIDRNDLRKLQPFDRLNDDALSAVIDGLVESGGAKWWEKDMSLRIYWRSLESWADIVLAEARRRNKNLIYGFQGLQEISPGTSGLPVADKRKILDILVERQVARWVEDENNIVKVIQ